MSENRPTGPRQDRPLGPRNDRPTGPRQDRPIGPRNDRPPSPTWSRPPLPEPERPLLPAPLRGLGLNLETIPTVAVRSAFLHPLVFKKMVAGPLGPNRPQPGDIVRVVDRDQEQPLGYALWNPRSQIALRRLSDLSTVPDEAFWERRIRDAVRLRASLLNLDKQGDAYRLIHAEGDGLTGLIVDRYADTLSIECFSQGIYQRIGPILNHLHAAAGTTRHRVRMDSDIAAAEGLKADPIDSPELPGVRNIHEHGIRYRVRFEGSHKTGFFCDQRDNRHRLADFCADKQVLDVCCYTGGFGLNAKLRGHASEVTCVDLDEKAIAQAKDNANLNQTRLNLVHSDAFGYMRQMGINGKSFGVIVLDPSKLIPNRDEMSPGKRKYFDLNVLALKLVEPGGILLTCSCSGLLSTEEFVGILRAAARTAGRTARILAITGAAPDHPVGIDVPESSYLKAVWLEVGDQITQGSAQNIQLDSTGESDEQDESDDEIGDS